MKNKESDLNDIYQVVMHQATQGIWEVNLQAQTFRMMGDSKCFPTALQQALPFPDGLIKMGWIAPESEDSFREFAQTLLMGSAQSYANFKVFYQETKQYGWVSFSYRTLMDDEGRPMRAAGVIEALSRQGGHSSVRPRENLLPECLVTSLVMQAGGNLTEDALTFWWSEGKDKTDLLAEQSCSKILADEQRRVADSGHDSSFASVFCRDALLARYGEESNTWLRREYCRMDDGGSIHWVRCVINLYRDKESGGMLFDLWVTDLERRRHWEQKFDVTVRRQQPYDLYTALTMREFGTHLMAQKERGLCAMVLVSVEGLLSMRTQSQGQAEQSRQGVVTALTLALGGACLIGQLTTDCFAVFFPGLDNGKALERRLEEVLVFVRHVTADLPGSSHLRFVMGGSCAYPGETNYELLIKRAQGVLERWRASAGDRVVLSGESDAATWEQQRRRQENDRVRTATSEIGRPLASREKDAVLNMLLAMLDINSLEESAGCVLRTLGEYYNADRVYILGLTDQGRTVVLLHEWNSARKSSLKNVISGTLTKKFSLLQQCIREERPIFLSRLPEVGEGREGWHFAVFPMQEDESTQAYLCVENARNHMSDATLATLLGDCLLKTRRRFQLLAKVEQDEGRTYGVELPNYSVYMENIYSYHSEVYHSLGVVCVDIPNFPAINNVQGYEYGRQILRYIARAITDIFGPGMVYRTWDAEFVALCPNTNQQVFFGRCMRLRTILNRNYAKEIRMGYNWSDRVFTGKALVDDAKNLMRGGMKGDTAHSPGSLPLPLARYDNVRDMISAGCFTAFFQPKIDMTSGELVGAEALVRGIDELGTAIAPVQFVENFEQDGSIREVDFYVLNRAMSLLSRCQQEGGKLVPISVNFSRATLFDTRGPASALAIQSRYPELPPGLVEAEITEGVGSIGQSTLAHVMEKYREFGLTFALDDLGAKYSNLSLFTAVPFEEIKLDRSLVVDIASNEKSQAMVRSIAQLCRENNIRCVAEGVETAEQVDALCRSGCTVAQGYYYDRPIPEQMFFDKYLIGQKRRPGFLNHTEAKKE